MPALSFTLKFMANAMNIRAVPHCNGELSGNPPCAKISCWQCRSEHGAPACRLQRPAGHRHRRAELRALADACPPRKNRWLPTINVATATGWADGRQADRRRRHGGRTRSRPGSTIRARSMCCRMATCWWPRATRRRSRTTARASGAGSETGHEPRRRRRAERQPHHAAARRRRRRRRRDPKRVHRAG